MTNKQDEKCWQNTLDALESVKVGKVLDGEVDGSVNYKHDVQRYLDEKFR